MCLRPRLGRILELTEQAHCGDGWPQAPGGQWPVRDEMSARIPHQALGAARQDGVAARAENETGIAIGSDQRHQLGVGEVTVAAQRDTGLRPVLPQQAQYALHDHGVLGPGRALARTRHGG